MIQTPYTEHKVIVESYLFEFRRYDAFIRKALDQIDERALNQLPVEDGNSIAVLIRHLSGNITSRFTDFLTSDGEKEWRQRDSEFEIRQYSADDVSTMWNGAWKLLETTLQELTDADLERTVTIRNLELTVRSALLRAMAHISFHAGQIVLLARIDRSADWDWITVPRGESEAYNANPTLEKGFS